MFNLRWKYSLLRHRKNSSFEFLRCFKILPHNSQCIFFFFFWFIMLKFYFSTICTSIDSFPIVPLKKTKYFPRTANVNELLACLKFLPHVVLDFFIIIWVKVSKVLCQRHCNFPELGFLILYQARGFGCIFQCVQHKSSI